MAAGGALGAPARKLIGGWIRAGGHGFPYGTLVVNISGSFLLGLVLAYLVRRRPAMQFIRLGVAVGFIGAYTTFSAFAYETLQLLNAGHHLLALQYVGGSVLGGFAAVWMGTMVGERL